MHFTETGVSIHEAISSASKEFDLPLLRFLAESTRILDELGGGDRATELLESAAEEARFAITHKRNIKTRTAEIQNEMTLSAIVCLLTFGILALDRGGAYYQAIFQIPWLILIGIGFLVLGWIIVRSILNSAAKTM